ncbi:MULTISPECIES: ATP-binding protein [unclassified Streptomyces]|uniref:ATP-binding protein n=1 Tax=unclassified Streptomyces TaxID=2593676 RepID=UPI0004AABDC7|nr:MULTISPECIES: ATP-binding protein [unclassified Streptomyces]APU41207.1 ATP-binding protein [Streptomyces sp. TN58]KJK52453.1 histidine kinase [Streptomyces sp. NRRL F-4428]
MEAHQLTFTLSPTPIAVPTARRQMRDAIAAWPTVPATSEAVHTAELVVSELVTNAVRYAGHQPISVVAQLSDAVLRVEVSDASRALPKPALPDEDSEGGRGLFLVGVLADRFGTAPTESGKCCWAEIDMAAPPPAGAAATLLLPTQRSCT